MNDFDNWNNQKKELDKSEKSPFFKPAQIWWVQFGTNIATETKGKGEKFLRSAV